MAAGVTRRIAENNPAFLNRRMALFHWVVGGKIRSELTIYELRIDDWHYQWM